MFLSRLKLLSIIVVISFALPGLKAQFKWGLSDYSIAVTDVQYGLPFIKTFPVHPGLEIGTTFLKNEKKFTTHSVSATAGYFYHSLIAHAPYIRAEYNYQIRIKKTIGIDMGGGIGYLHAFYPGEGYRYNEESGEYESVLYQQAFLRVNASLGISLVKFEKIRPFVRYEQTMMNDFFHLMCLLSAGVKIRL